MKRNINKIKTMIIGVTNIKHDIKIEGQKIEQVERFTYLAAVINNRGTINDEINERVAKTGGLFMFNPIKTKFLNKQEIPPEVKLEVVRTIVKPILPFNSESWTTSERQRSEQEKTKLGTKSSESN